MYKYNFIIDGEEYNAIFHSHKEAVEFVKDNEKDGSMIQFISEKEISINELLDDNDFRYDYKIENIAIAILPNWKSFRKWHELEFELIRLHII